MTGLATVVAGSLAMPLPALAASGSAPSPDAKPAAAEPEVELIHLVDLQSSSGLLRKLNNRGQVIGTLPNPASPSGKNPKAVLFARESVTDLHASLGGDFHVSDPRDINNHGAVLVGTDDTSSFLVKDGKATRLNFPATAINDSGQIAGPGGVHDPDGSVLKLQAFKGQYLEPTALANDGTVVGFADIDPGPLIGFSAFRTKPGEPLVMSRDRLTFGTAKTQATDVNDHGQVAGYVDNPGNTNDIPIIWDRSGTPQEQGTTPSGERVYGKVAAINNSGIGVGVMYDANDAPQAAMYLPGEAINLSTLVRAEGWDVNLSRATGINDHGQIAVIGRYPADENDHAFLLDLGFAEPEIRSIDLLTQLPPSTAWVPVPEGGVYEGNRIRVNLQASNPGDLPQRRTLQVIEEGTGKPLPGGTFNLTIQPGETVERSFIWDTKGYSWLDHRPRSNRSLSARLFSGNTYIATVDKELKRPVTVKPMPLVLVHGFRSTADRWDAFEAIAKGENPLQEVYRVNTMNTGDPDDRTKPTKPMLENSSALHHFVQGLREEKGFDKVVVVAHSMGGNIVKYYMSHFMPIGLDRKPVVHRVLQMGTPNTGSKCADLAARASTALNWWAPALRENTSAFVGGLNRMLEKDGYSHGNFRGVRISNLVGVGRKLVCSLSPAPVHYFEDSSDGVVETLSARWKTDSGWNLRDIVLTKSEHTAMTEKTSDYRNYIAPRLSADSSTSPEYEGPSPVAPESAPEKQPAGEASGPGKSGVSAETAAEAEAVTDSVFAFPSATVGAGATVTVPVEVPQGAAFGAVTALPSTVGMLLRDPSGAVAASYAPGSDAAKEPFQGLRVDNPQTGVWKLEITNAGSGPVEALASAWVAGNPLTVTAKSEQSSADGRVTVSATVTDAGRPVTGAQVRATVTGDDGVARELTLNDDGAGEAGDGVYGATSEALADGFYIVTVTADTAQGMRVTGADITVEQIDTREFALTLSAGPGGSVAASPAREVYRAGSTVKVIATPEAGRVPIGWTVDGKERGPGPLTLTMNEAHTVEARFGTYTVTEIGALPGGDASKTVVHTLNDRGQVAATVTGQDGKAHAVRWQDGTITELGGLACTDGETKCETGAYGINEAGEVAGSAVASVNGGNSQHAVIWRNDGSVTDLHAGNSSANLWGNAFAVNDNGQVLGEMAGPRYVMWDRGAAVAMPADYDPGWSGYHNEWNQFRYSRINNHGAVTGGYELGGRDGNGLPRDTGPAVYADGVLTKLAGTVEGCARTAGQTSDLNNTGLVVGTLRCGRYENTTTKRAYVWKDGKPTDLGAGEATAVNDNELIVGSEPGSYLNVYKPPVMWVDGTKHPLADALSRPWCPEDFAKTTQPCVGIGHVLDVNISGQILVKGFLRDRAPDRDGFIQQDRALLLSPTTARADLAVTTEVSASEPGPGSTVTWTATVTNKGDDAATDVRLDVFIPQSVTGATCDTWRGQCAPIKGGFRNTVKVLEPGWSATVEVSATVPAGTAGGTELKASAHGYSVAVTDPKPANNTASATATVRPLLSTTGIVWPEPVQVGQVSYASTVTLTNRLNAPIPLRVIAVSGTFTQANDCPVELAVGKVCTVQVRFAPTVEGPAGGALTFTTADGAEPAFTVPLTGQGAKAGGTPVVQVPAAPVRGTVGKPFTLKIPFTDGDAGDTHTAKVAWGDGPPVEAEVTQRPGGGTLEVTRTFTAPRTGTALVMVYDSGGALGTAAVPYVIEEAAANTAPVLDAGGDVELSVGERLRRVVTFTDPDSTSWTASVDYGDGAGPRPVTPDTARQITLEHQWATAGTYPVTVTVKDDGGLEATATFTATVVSADTPNQAPVVTLETHFDTIETGTGWVGIGSFTDPDSTSWTYTADYGDGAGPQPLSLTAGQLKLQHVYASAGDHTVVLAITDDKGATGTARLTVHVTNAAPEVTLTAPAVAKVVPVGKAVALSATFTDAGSTDTHTATWSIGGKPVPGAVTGHRGKGTVTGWHTFTEAGLYPIAVTVTDNHHATTTATTGGGGKQAYVLVYDPADTLVGAGQSTTPAGACTLNTKCAPRGKATLDVTAGYHGKDTTPTGELRYTAPGFDLRDTSPAVLAAAGGTAILRGTGKVNKTIEVNYEITTIDSGQAADGTDRLAVRVWTKKNGELIYDTSASPVPVTGVIRVSG
ncbi:alpha/beta fold hydrolase [Streptosporangium amethystogenes]|uniref:alpha/beta fold hydrolase n=1 Tax=Streptosporangium amethystogenes TaxID=2002 RepID=UPI0031DBCC70